MLFFDFKSIATHSNFQVCRGYNTATRLLQHGYKINSKLSIEQYIRQLHFS